MRLPRWRSLDAPRLRLPFWHASAVMVDQVLHALRGAAVHLVAALHEAGIHLRPRACSA